MTPHMACVQVLAQLKSLKLLKDWWVLFIASMTFFIKENGVLYR